MWEPSVLYREEVTKFQGSRLSGEFTVSVSVWQGVSECYECTPPPATKTFPGCTIRNTPSQPIHCIVWAKHLFSQLFGEPDADNDVSPETEDPEQPHQMDGRGERVVVSSPL